MSDYIKISWVAVSYRILTAVYLCLLFFVYIMLDVFGRAVNSPEEIQQMDDNYIFTILVFVVFGLVVIFINESLIRLSESKSRVWGYFSRFFIFLELLILLPFFIY